MDTSEIIGLAAGIVVLAGISMAILNGDKTAKVIGSAGNAFIGSIQAATQQRVTA